VQPDPRKNGRSEISIMELTIYGSCARRAVLTHMGNFMTLMISNLTVSTKAPVGTVIGALAMYDATAVSRTANYISDENSAGYFGVNGNQLVTIRASIPPGYYGVQIYANAEYVSLCGEAAFVVTVTAT
jgi:hypothetical protein